MKEIIRIVLICIFFTLNNTIIIAQSITGALLDENKKPLEFANIILLSAPDSTFIQGTISDKNGNFIFRNINNSSKILKVSFIGYNTLIMKCSKDNMGKLMLTKSETDLNEVKIIGHIPTFSLKNNTLLAKVENTLLSSTGSAIDVIRRIPGLRVLQDNNIEVFGKGTPLVYINNRQVRDMTEIIQLDSKVIKSIELINSPGAKYDATVKSVIIIKTKKDIGEGLGGSFQVYGTKGKKMGNGEYINLNYRVKRLDLFSSFDHTLGRRNEEQKNENIIYGNRYWDISDSSVQISRNRFTKISIGGNYLINSNNSIGLMYYFIKAGYKVHANSHTLALANSQIDDEISQNDIRTQLTNRHYINTYYNGMFFKNLKVDFNFDYLHEDNNTGQIIDEKSILENRTITTNGNAANSFYASKLIFSYPFTFGTIMLGVEWNLVNRTSRYINKEELLQDSNSKVEENRIAGFIGYSKNFKGLSIEAGFRYESVKFDYFENNILKPDQSRKYSNLFPNMSFSYTANKVNLSLDYVSKIMRPSFYMLQDEIRYNNRFTLEQGNPLLSPEKTHDITLSSSYDFIIFSINYQYTKDFITTLFKSYAEDESVSLFTYENTKKSQVLNFNLSLSPKIGIWEPSLSINIRKPFLEVEHRRNIINLNKSIVFLNFNNSFCLPLGFILSADFDYSTIGNYSNSRLKETGGVNFGLRNSFLNNRLAVNLQFFDIFATQRNSYAFYGDINYFSKWSKGDTQQLRLSLTYRFNASNNKYKGKGTTKDDINRL